MDFVEGPEMSAPAGLPVLSTAVIANTAVVSPTHASSTGSSPINVLNLT